MNRIAVLSLVLVAAACGKKKEPAPELAAGPAQAGSAQAGSAQAFTPPGACVDPVADAAKRLADVENLGEPPHEQPGPDVDGDGTPDKLFSVGAGYTTNTLLYVMRGACGHYVGDIGMPPDPPKDPARNHGLIDLRTAEVSNCEGAPCGCEEGWEVLRFDGTEYKLDEKASKHSVEKPCK